MSIGFGVLALAAIVLIPAGIGIVAAWIALKCYPWRRCGRCGWNEWRIFRTAGVGR